MLVYDDTALREPNLLIPGRMPAGPVKVAPNDLGIKGYYRQISGGNDPQIFDLAKGKLMGRYLSGSGFDSGVDRFGRYMKALSTSSNIYTSDDVLPPANLTIAGMYSASSEANSTDNVICGFIQSENTSNISGGNCAVAIYAARSYFGSQVISVVPTYSDASTDSGINLSGTFSSSDVWAFAVSIEDATEIRMAALNHTTKKYVSYSEALTKSLNQSSQPFTVAGFKPYAASYAWIRSAQNLNVYDVFWGDKAASMARLKSIVYDPHQFLAPA